MADTMTLETFLRQLPDFTWLDHERRACVQAAIRERDELRHDLSEVEEHAKIYCRERDAAMALNLENAKGAEKAEAELAALRKRIAEAPVYEIPLSKPISEDGWIRVIESVKNERSVRGKRVRLVVEDETMNRTSVLLVKLDD